MQLLILRHGKAFDHAPDSQGDFHRELEEKGREQAANVARILVASDSLPDIVLCSPLIRARQTAEAFTAAAQMPGALICNWLSCGMSPELALSELTAFPDFERVMIVGHEPDFSTLIQHTLGAHGNTVEVRKGSLACLEIYPPASRARLSYLLPFKLAKHLD